MFNQVQASQAASAMKMEESSLWTLLNQCGIQPKDASLTRDQLGHLALALEERQAASQRRAQEKLERLVGQYTVLVDTCSLLNQRFPLLMEHLEPLLRARGKALIVPYSMVRELVSLSTKQPELTERIRALLPLMAQLQQQGLLRVYGSPS